MRLARALCVGVALTRLPSIAMAQIDERAVLAKLRPCSNQGPDSPATKIPNVVLGSLDRDGCFLEATVAPESDSRGARGGPLVLAGNVVMLAVRNPRCQPWPVPPAPPAPYESWKAAVRAGYAFTGATASKRSR